MATLLELTQMLGERGSLYDKVRGALLVAAQTIVANASATDAQKAWAREVLHDPGAHAATAYHAVIAANNAATVAQLQSATDEQVNTAVQAVLPVLTG